MPAKDLVQLRVVQPGMHMIDEGCVRGPKGSRKGDVFWARRENATNAQGKGYVDTGFAEPVGAGLAAERPVVGPAETKPAGPAETKSSSGGPDGRSIDSPKSGEPGTVASSSVSEADQVSTPRRSRRSKRGGAKASSEGSSEE